jgi:hypothetical protein
MKYVKIADSELSQALTQLPAGLSGVEQSLGLAYFIVDRLLSKKWLKKHVLPGCTKPGFFSVDMQKLDLTCYRVIDLAELLYNLQDITGFDHCLSNLRKGHMEGTYAELDLGRMLHMYRVNFVYNSPHGMRGDDYDVEIAYPDGLVICTEAKCKVESTGFGARTVRASLQQVTEQIPTDRPGAAFVKVPQN